MRSTKAGVAAVAATVWTIACGTSGPVGPVVHEHHTVERGAATSARVEISMSAGEVEVKSGAATLFAGDFDFNILVLNLDLRGTPSTGYSVSVQAGAGDTTIRLPASVGISARTSGLIGDSNVSGLEKRDGRWVNPRAEASPVTIDMQVQHAIGDLRLLAE